MICTCVYVCVPVRVRACVYSQTPLAVLRIFWNACSLLSSFMWRVWSSFSEVCACVFMCIHTRVCMCVCVYVCVCEREIRVRENRRQKTGKRKTRTATEVVLILDTLVTQCSYSLKVGAHVVSTPSTNTKDICKLRSKPTTTQVNKQM